MSNPYGPGQGPEGAGWQPYSEPTVVGQPQFGQFPPPPGPGGPPPAGDPNNGDPNYGGPINYGDPNYGDPNYGAYQPYAQTAPPGAWPQGGGGGPVPPATSKKPLFIALGAVAAAVIVILVVSLVVFTGGGSEKPDATVKSYLQALADGDAGKARGLMKGVASDTLLTDEILKKQQAIAKISDIKIIDTTSGGGIATVQATYLFGDRKADETFMMSKTGDDWRIDDGAVAIDLTNMRVPELTLFGVAVDKESKVYVFPGPLEWGSANKNFSVVDDHGSEFDMIGSSYGGSLSGLTVALSPAGTKLVESTLQTYLDNCALSKQIDAGTDKPGCEQDTYDYLAEANSATWSAPTDFAKLEFRLAYDNPNEVSVSGELEWGLTYRVRASGSDPAGTKTGTVTDFMYGDIDISKGTPVFTPS